MKKIIQVSLLAAILLLAGCSALPPDETSDTGTNMNNKIHGHADLANGKISPGDLYQKLQNKDNFVLLDVREDSEYEEAHIPGTTNLISVKSISAQTLTEAGIKPEDEIIIYCRSGSRSVIAQRELKNLGYENVLNMSGGIIHWMEDELPTESGKYVRPLNPEIEVTPGPSISFNQIKYDFGEIPQFGGTVETTFIVMNKGTETLEIGSITTSCACTSAKIEQTSIKPSEETQLKVVFDPDLHEEPLDKFKRTIFIPTNDPKNPEAELTISVDILENQ